MKNNYMVSNENEFRDYENEDENNLSMDLVLKQTVAAVDQLEDQDQIFASSVQSGPEVLEMDPFQEDFLIEPADFHHHESVPSLPINSIPAAKSLKRHAINASQPKANNVALKEVIIIDDDADPRPSTAKKAKLSKQSSNTNPFLFIEGKELRRRFGDYKYYHSGNFKPVTDYQNVFMAVKFEGKEKQVDFYYPNKRWEKFKKLIPLKDTCNLNFFITENNKQRMLTDIEKHNAYFYRENYLYKAPNDNLIKVDTIQPSIENELVSEEELDHQYIAYHLVTINGEPSELLKGIQCDRVMINNDLTWNYSIFKNISPELQNITYLSKCLTSELFRSMRIYRNNSLVDWFFPKPNSNHHNSQNLSSSSLPNNKPG